jgi:hypothetical protein
MARELGKWEMSNYPVRLAVSLRQPHFNDNDWRGCAPCIITESEDEIGKIVNHWEEQNRVVQSQLVLTREDGPLPMAGWAVLFM